MSPEDLLHLTSDIVSAFVSHNQARASEIPELIAAVHSTLAGVSTAQISEPVAELKPAVSIKKSISDDFLICLDDGKKFRSLKRHLASLGMTPDDYRAKWGLPQDYPMVAPCYAAKRSELARAMGLGSNRRTSAGSAAVAESKATGLALQESRVSGTNEAATKPEASASADGPKRRARAKKAA